MQAHGGAELVGAVQGAVAGLAVYLLCHGYHGRSTGESALPPAQLLQTAPAAAGSQLEPEPEPEPDQQCFVPPGSAAARLEQQLASRELVYESLKLAELKVLIEGRGRAPLTLATGPLRLALIEQAKALPPACEEGRQRTPPAPVWLQRTALLLGDDAVASLASARVLVVGTGGVGSWCAEFLVRGGIGHIMIIDDDVVDPTNRNRQLPALASTEKRPKVEVLADRLVDINPQLKIVARQMFLPPDPVAVDKLIETGMEDAAFDWVVDAIDSITPKVELIRAALKHRVRIVSSMGAGGRLDPSQVLVTDLSSLQWDRHSLTKFVQAAKRSDKATGKGKGGDRVGACPQGPSTSTSTSPADNSQVCAHEKLGTLVRKKLAKKYGIEGGVPVVTSTEMPRKAFALTPDKAKNKASYYGTWSCLPATFGMHAASLVLNSLVSARGEGKAFSALRAAAEAAAARH